MASYEIPYLLLLSLTPVYFCKLKVNGDLHFSDQDFFFPSFFFFSFLSAVAGGRSRVSCLSEQPDRSGDVTGALRRGLHPAGPAACPLAPPDARPRGAPTCASAQPRARTASSRERAAPFSTWEREILPLKTKPRPKKRKKQPPKKTNPPKSQTRTCGRGERGGTSPGPRFAPRNVSE